MCFQCENPELTYADYLDQVILPLVRRNGWAVQGVTGRRPFAYTVGLTDCGLPELVVTGLRDGVAATVLNAAAAEHLHEQLVPGARVTAGGLALEVLPVAVPGRHLLTAFAVYGDQVSALQLVWPDGRGRYPWDLGQRPRRVVQELFGSRPGQR